MTAGMARQAVAEASYRAEYAALPWRISGEQGISDQWLWPAQYAQVTGQGAQLPLSLIMLVVAAVVVWLLYRAAPVHNVAQAKD